MQRFSKRKKQDNNLRKSSEDDYHRDKKHKHVQLLNTYTNSRSTNNETKTFENSDNGALPEYEENKIDNISKRTFFNIFPKAYIKAFLQDEKIDITRMFKIIFSNFLRIEAYEMILVASNLLSSNATVVVVGGESINMILNEDERIFSPNIDTKIIPLFSNSNRNEYKSNFIKLRRFVWNNVLDNIISQWNERYKCYLHDELKSLNFGFNFDVDGDLFNYDQAPFKKAYEILTGVNGEEVHTFSIDFHTSFDIDGQSSYDLLDFVLVDTLFDNEFDDKNSLIKYNFNVGDRMFPALPFVRDNCGKSKQSVKKICNPKDGEYVDRNEQMGRKLVDMIEFENDRIKLMDPLLDRRISQFSEINFASVYYQVINIKNLIVNKIRPPKFEQDVTRLLKLLNMLLNKKEKYSDIKNLLGNKLKSYNLNDETIPDFSDNEKLLIENLIKSILPPPSPKVKVNTFTKILDTKIVGIFDQVLDELLSVKKDEDWSISLYCINKIFDFYTSILESNLVKDDESKEEYDEDSLKSKTVAQLKALAKSKNIRLTSNKKQDILDMLLAETCDEDNNYKCPEDKICNLKTNKCYFSEEDDKVIEYEGIKYFGSEEDVKKLTITDKPIDKTKYDLLSDIYNEYSTLGFDSKTLLESIFIQFIGKYSYAENSREHFKLFNFIKRQSIHIDDKKDCSKILYNSIFTNTIIEKHLRDKFCYGDKDVYSKYKKLREEYYNNKPIIRSNFTENYCQNSPKFNNKLKIRSIDLGGVFYYSTIHYTPLYPQDMVIMRDKDEAIDEVFNSFYTNITAENKKNILKVSEENDFFIDEPLLFEIPSKTLNLVIQESKILNNSHIREVFKYNKTAKKHIDGILFGGDKIFIMDGNITFSEEKSESDDRNYVNLLTPKEIKYFTKIMNENASGSYEGKECKNSQMIYCNIIMERINVIKKALRHKYKSDLPEIKMRQILEDYLHEKSCNNDFNNYKELVEGYNKNFEDLLYSSVTNCCRPWIYKMILDLQEELQDCARIVVGGRETSNFAVKNSARMVSTDIDTKLILYFSSKFIDYYNSSKYTFLNKFFYVNMNSIIEKYKDVYRDYIYPILNRLEQTFEMKVLDVKFFKPESNTWIKKRHSILESMPDVLKFHDIDLFSFDFYYEQCLLPKVPSDVEPQGSDKFAHASNSFGFIDIPIVHADSKISIPTYTTHLNLSFGSLNPMKSCLSIGLVMNEYEPFVSKKILFLNKDYEIYDKLHLINTMTRPAKAAKDKLTYDSLTTTDCDTNFIEEYKGKVDDIICDIPSKPTYQNPQQYIKDLLTWCKCDLRLDNVRDILQSSTVLNTTFPGLLKSMRFLFPVEFALEDFKDYDIPVLNKGDLLGKIFDYKDYLKIYTLARPDEKLTLFSNLSRSYWKPSQLVDNMPVRLNVQQYMQLDNNKRSNIKDVFLIVMYKNLKYCVNLFKYNRNSSEIKYRLLKMVYGFPYYKDENVRLIDNGHLCLNILTYWFGIIAKYGFRNDNKKIPMQFFDSHETLNKLNEIKQKSKPDRTSDSINEELYIEMKNIAENDQNNVYDLFESEIDVDGIIITSRFELCKFITSKLFFFIDMNYAEEITHNDSYINFLNNLQNVKTMSSEDMQKLIKEEEQEDEIEQNIEVSELRRSLSQSDSENDNDNEYQDDNY